MILDEQLINGMFQDQSVQQNSEQPLQQVSLNFTYTSRSSKNHKKQTHTGPKQSHNDQLDIFAIAESQLNKFNEEMKGNESIFESNFLSIEKKLAQMQKYCCEGVNERDVETIKNQLFRKQNDKAKDQYCQTCNELREKIVQLESTLAKTTENLAICQQQLINTCLKKEVEAVKDELVSNVEINMLSLEIRQLNQDIAVLKSQKNNLEKTFLFNKTKNSEMQFRMELQKSKGLSAAKNSTNSSELMNRNETIVFIDPIQSDVDEWIKFFESQKNRYMSMCKKQQSERIKQLGRSFTREERIQLHEEGRLFVLFSSIKLIWKNLIKIRQNTNSFLASSSSKSFLKDKFNSQNDGDVFTRDEIQRLNTRLSKLMKLNEYLLREKENLEDINESLKTQRIKQNHIKYKLQEELSQSLSKLGIMMTRINQCEEERKMLVKSLTISESELQAKAIQLRRCKKLIEGKNSSKGHRSSSHKIQLS